MAEPPSLAGATQVTEILSVPAADATNSVGAPGTVASVVAPSTLEGRLVPLALMADTR